ncbi:hypothetical protein [Embleya sp. NBC_00896]|uniref:hypothetical protein n=1 Tax=Embleya sp. NBC_00896 TaxID=2975961 RepID=UPI003868D10E|nr:hypothetical protein OG928_14135 [Embleya sp. NBC_00896]
MSYWGWNILVKGDHTLAEHPAITEYAGIVEAEYVMGEWRELRMDGLDSGGSGDIAAIVRATGAPAMAFYVLGDDCAIGEAAAPSGPIWYAVFRYDDDYAKGLPPGYRREDTVANALAWATQAGLTADPAKVEHAFAEGWMDDLYAAFGLPESTPADT